MNDQENKNQNGRITLDEPTQFTPEPLGQFDNTLQPDKNRFLKPIAIGAIIIAILVLVISTAFFAFYNSNCQSLKNSYKDDKKAQITTFENTKLVSFDSASVDTELRGDCFHSTPMVELNKSIKSQNDSAELRNDMRSTLQTQGFVLTEERVQHNDCGYVYSATAEGNGIKTDVSLTTYDDTNYSCFGGPEVDAAELVGKPANSLRNKLIL